MESPNVLLVVLDTARAKTVLPEMEDGHMPELRSISGEGVTFTGATTTGPWTVPSHASLFTGQYTSDHGTHGGDPRFASEVPSLASRLGADGYRTAGLSANSWVSPEFGFDEGFDSFSMKWERVWSDVDLMPIYDEDTVPDRLRALADVLTARNAPRTLLNAFYAKFLAGRHDDGARNETRRAVKWIRERAGDERPFFLFVNYIEPHLEYDPPETYRRQVLESDQRERAEEVNQDPWEYVAGDAHMDEEDFEVLERLYRGELRYVDDQIGRLYDVLDETGQLEDTVIVIVGDHGENVGDHGLMDHQYCLYETLLRVPLVVRYPDRFGAGTTCGGPVEVRDLYPTILDLAGVDVPSDETVSDHSLVPDDGGVPTRDHAIAEYVTPQPSMDALREKVESFRTETTRFDRALRSIRTETWKLIEGSDGSVELYDLASDPDEGVDVSSDHESVVADLRSELEASRGPLTRGATGEVCMTDQSKRRLEDLGYLQ
ncbi:sulfatase [Halobacteriales archaeon QS_1_68_20]|nr:MAG: sulfatase [Halobacteriales archaeon QS_1_68_20]